MPAPPASATTARIEAESPEVIMLREAERTSGDEWRRRESNPRKISIE
jgi:hypothetical protein